MLADTMKNKKIYSTPDYDIFYVSARDILKDSNEFPDGSTDENIDENQGEWI